jgi:hypothetical protein
MFGLQKDEALCCYQHQVTKLYEKLGAAQRYYFSQGKTDREEFGEHSI